MVWSYIVLSAFSVAAIAPIVGIVLVALRPDGVIGGQLSFPGGLDLANFGEAWSTGHFGSSLWASAQVVVVVVPCAALLSIFAGYSFGTMSYPGRDLIFMLFLFGLIVPQEATITRSSTP